MDDHPKMFLVHGSGSILLYEMRVPRKCFLLYRNGAEQTSYLLQKGKWAKINLNIKGVRFKYKPGCKPCDLNSSALIGWNILSNLNAVISTNERNWSLTDHVTFKLPYNQNLTNENPPMYIFGLEKNTSEIKQD